MTEKKTYYMTYHHGPESNPGPLRLGKTEAETEEEARENVGKVWENATGFRFIDESQVAGVIEAIHAESARAREEFAKKYPELPEWTAAWLA